MAAAPPVWRRAATKGHWNTTLEIPVIICKASKARIALPQKEMIA
jgi:hypothetical protein